MALFLPGLIGAMMNFWNYFDSKNQQEQILQDTAARPPALDAPATRTYLRTMRGIGGGVYKGRTSASFTTAVDNFVRIQQLYSVDLPLQNLLTAENTVLAVSSYKLDLEMYHPDAPFEALAVIILGSPDHVNVSGDSVEHAPHLITEEWITVGEWGAIYSPFINSRRIVDGGNLRYISSYSLNLTKIAQKYAALLSQREMTAEDFPVLRVGLMVWSDPAGNPVICDVRSHVNYNLVKRTFGV